MTEFSFPRSAELEIDVRHGLLGRDAAAPGLLQPQVVRNVEAANQTVLRILREELQHSHTFLFSTAFVTPRAIALLKQELVDFAAAGGHGTVVTSTYLRFNSPAAFAELLNLERLGLSIRVHADPAFHPKGYLFTESGLCTAMIGSSNLTENALVRNHEWNLKITAATGSDLGDQLAGLMHGQIADSEPLTQGWIDAYAADWTPPPRPTRRQRGPAAGTTAAERIEPTPMQREALAALAELRASGERRGLVISATGTGKTMLSALDVRAAGAGSTLFLVHREQILDRTIAEYRRALGGAPDDFGKLSGSSRQIGARHVFATVQTLSKPEVLNDLGPDRFDYIVVDEAHRAVADTYRRVLDHFAPRFLLGMTATPERMDGDDVYALFHHNVPYEIRLHRALEDNLLCPFHYYGVADVALDGPQSGSPQLPGATPELAVLISPDRVDHLIRAVEIYGQASVAPRGLIFCSRIDEARELSAALNRRTLRGQPLRTLALSGSDPVEDREAAVNWLQSGDLDYLLTVDVFNEGVDIPSVNQIILLRQTQSATVFVQQLGRGLRKHDSKEYVVVLDFIGNYQNNYLIPVALFGDESLHKESLNQKLAAAEESGVLPGLSSVRFDQVSQRRVLSSIADTRLDSLPNLKQAIVRLRSRLGRTPDLADFLAAESADPVLLATRRNSYPDLVEHVLRTPLGLTQAQHAWLKQLSHEILPAARGHEFEALAALLVRPALSESDLARVLVDADLPVDRTTLASVGDSFTLATHSARARERYGPPVAAITAGQLRLDDGFVAAYQQNPAFHRAVDDIVATGRTLVAQRYAGAAPFARGYQYSRAEMTRLLGWRRSHASTIYGYKIHQGVCPIFITLHKPDTVSASVRYGDRLIDPRTLQWYSRSKRRLTSPDVAPIIANSVRLEVFVQRDDADGPAHYYLGRATADHVVQTEMPGSQGQLDVVTMQLRLDQPVSSALFDYFHPTLLA